MQPEITRPAPFGVLDDGETSFLFGSADTCVPTAETFVLTTQRLRSFTLRAKLPTRMSY